jgi:hypothetical protein
MSTSTTTAAPVEVPGQVLKGINYATGRGIDLTDVDDVRRACRQGGFFYASAWIGNHGSAYINGAISGFTARLEDAQEDDASYAEV